MARLELRGFSAGHGDVGVLHGVSLVLEASDSLALLGRNGMGKSTLLASLMGLTRQTAGQILLDGEDISGWPPHQRARAGLGWVPQERHVFGSLTVQENLTVVQRSGAWTLERVYASFPRLRERRFNPAHQLSGGEQQMLAMGRALMLNPLVLLLDEPLEGLAPLVAQELLAAIGAMLADKTMAIILVEQHAQQILPLTRQAVVLERGRVVYQDLSTTLSAQPALLERWLGVG